MEARSDLAWWDIFLESWNDISLMSAMNRRTPDASLTSDTSGGWRCGRYWDDRWFQLAWKDTQCPPSMNIPVKELIPIVLTVALWVQEWQGKVVGCRCDNQAVVAVLHSRTSMESDMMHLLCCLFFFEAAFSFHITALRSAGAANTLADDISCNNMLSVLQVFTPMAMANRAMFPRPLLDLHPERCLLGYQSICCTVHQSKPLPSS